MRWWKQSRENIHKTQTGPAEDKTRWNKYVISSGKNVRTSSVVVTFINNQWVDCALEGRSDIEVLWLYIALLDSYGIV